MKKKNHIRPTDVRPPHTPTRQGATMFVCQLWEGQLFPPSSHPVNVAPSTTSLWRRRLPSHWTPWWFPHANCVPWNSGNPSARISIRRSSERISFVSRGTTGGGVTVGWGSAGSGESGKNGRNRIIAEEEEERTGQTAFSGMLKFVFFFHLFLFFFSVFLLFFFVFCGPQSTPTPWGTEHVFCDEWKLKSNLLKESTHATLACDPWSHTRCRENRQLPANKPAKE